MSSRKRHPCRDRRSEGGTASETLLCLADVETEIDAGAGTGGEVVLVFEVVGKGDVVDVVVVMASVRIVADVGTVDDEEGAANGLEKEKVEEDAGIV